MIRGDCGVIRVARLCLMALAAIGTVGDTRIRHTWQDAQGLVTASSVCAVWVFVHRTAQSQGFWGISMTYFVWAWIWARCVKTTKTKQLFDVALFVGISMSVFWRVQHARSVRRSLEGDLVILSILVIFGALGIDLVCLATYECVLFVLFWVCILVFSLLRHTAGARHLVKSLYGDCLFIGLSVAICARGPQRAWEVCVQCLCHMTLYMYLFDAINNYANGPCPKPQPSYVVRCKKRTFQSINHMISCSNSDCWGRHVCHVHLCCTQTTGGGTAMSSRRAIVVFSTYNLVRNAGIS